MHICRYATVSYISDVNPATDVDAWNQEEIYYVRDGLLDEGWFYHEKLPPSWMYKQGRNRTSKVKPGQEELVKC